MKRSFYLFAFLFCTSILNVPVIAQDENDVPVCEIEIDANYNLNSDGPYLVELYALLETDEDETSNYEWELDSEPIASTSGYHLSHEISGPGSYRFYVAVDLEDQAPNWCNFAHDYLTVELFNQNEPPFIMEATVSKSEGCHGEFFDFEVAAVGNVTDWQWDFGDGSGINAEEASYDYPAPGIYYPTVTVCNEIGCAETIALPPITVSSLDDAACTAGCTNPDALNYDPDATIDDGSCGDTIFGDDECDASFLVVDLGNGNYDFENLSIGNELSYAWSFENGSPMTHDEHAFTHFAWPGMYEVCMFISSEDCFDGECQAVYVDPNPGPTCHAEFSWNLISEDGLTLEIVDLSEALEGELYFTFGDGDANNAGYFSSEEIEPHVYAEAGIYEICVTVLGADNCSDVYCDDISVGFVCDAATFPQSTDTPLELYIPNLSEGNNLTYELDYGDGEVENFGSDFTEVYHYYPDFGPYVLCITVFSEEDLCIDSECYNIVMEDSPCAIDLSVDCTSTPLEISVANPCPDCNHTYLVDFGDGNNETIGAGNIGIVHTYDEEGEYNVCLTVNTDDDCSYTDCEIIEVHTWEIECQAGLELIGSADLLGFYTINNQSIGSYLFYNISFGDGTSVDMDQEFFIQDHQFAASGEYNVCLTVSTVDDCPDCDELGCDDTFCQTVIVPANDCNLELDYFLMEGVFVFDIDGEVSTYQMDYGDGTVDEGEYYPWLELDHEYAEGISTTACLTIYGFDCTQTACAEINTSFCSSIWEFDVTGLELQIYNFATIIGDDPLYIFDFGDGTVLEFDDEADIPGSYTFEEAGTYQVCMEVLSSGNCSDELCYNITVEELVNDCSVELTSESFESGTVVYFEAIITGEITFSLMNYGDGTLAETGGEPNFFDEPHFYESGQDYVACLYIEGPNGCSEEFCLEIAVPSSPCQAGFVVSTSSESLTIGTNYNSAGAALNYSFDYGDGTVFDFAHADWPDSYEYAESGTYEICLTVSTDDGCTDSVCQEVTVEAPPTSFEVCGIISTDNATHDQEAFGEVYFIEVSEDGTLNVIETLSWGNGDGEFCFTAEADGEYMLKADLDRGSPHTHEYFPTYWGNVLSWSDSPTITIENQTDIDFDITLLSNSSEMDGNGSVGGTVEEGPGKVGEEIGEVCVYITDLVGNPLDYSLLTDSEFLIDELAPGQYWLYVDVLGATVDPVLITISADEPDLNYGFIYFSETVELNTAIEDILLEGIAVYPNPTRDELNISLEGIWQAKVINLQGQIISQHELNSINSILKLQVSELPMGNYFIHLKRENEKAVIRFLKN